MGVTAPAGWARVKAAEDGPAADPRTLLVVGTDGAESRRSRCQVTAYRVPADGAAVVVLGWRGKALAGVPRDRAELETLCLRGPYFECWVGRGASALLALRGRAYQVNVLVGDHATSQTIAEALRVARSFRAADAS